MTFDHYSARLIRKAREANQWSRKDLSRVSGVNSQRILRIEQTGRLTPTELAALVRSLPALFFDDAGLRVAS